MTANDRASGAKILLIEDDRAIASQVVRGLTAAGFTVKLAQDGRRGAELAGDHAFDLIVLDLMLPELDGFELLSLWRGHTQPPIIVLTALTDLDARLRVFKSGAVDYLAKPFWIEELVARIRTRLRLPHIAPARKIAWDDTVLDLDARLVTVNDTPITLTSAEFDILKFLVERPCRAIARGQLAEEALSDGDRYDRTIDSHVARVRRKLGPVAAARLVTVWGIGYRFDAPESP